MVKTKSTVKRSKGSFIILSLYVDDILLAENNKEFIKTIKEWLSSTFEMKTWVRQALCLVSRSSEIVTTQIRNMIQSRTGMLIPSLCLILTRTN